MSTPLTFDAQTSAVPHSPSWTRFLPVGGRIVLGLIFFIFGLNGFLNFIPMPNPPPPKAAMDWFGAMMATGYLLQLVAGTQVVCGALLLINRFVPLALAMLAPVIVNIVATHLFISPQGIQMALVVLFLELYLAWSYRSVFRPMLAARVAPG